LLDVDNDIIYVVNAGVDVLLETDNAFKDAFQICNINLSQEQDNNTLNTPEECILNIYKSFKKVLHVLGHYKVGFTSEQIDHVGNNYYVCTSYAYHVEVYE
jgi:hypothetical protein